MNVNKRRWVSAVAALSLVLLGGAPLWAQGKDRDGRGGGRKEGARQEGSSGRSSGAARGDSGRDADGKRSRTERRDDDTPRESTRPEPIRRDADRPDGRDADKERRGDTVIERIAAPFESDRDSEFSTRHRDRDRDRERHRDWDRDYYDDDGFSIGFRLGPISGYYGRPRYSYWGPWGGYYGPRYGYFGPWSGYYGTGWPYYSEIPVEERVYSSAYFDPDSPLPDAAERPGMSAMVSQEGLDFQRRAERAFRAGQYDEAVRWANHAAVEMPQNGRLFLFMSQALFAVGDYGAAAGAAQQGMAMSQPRDWGWLVQNFRRFYGNAADYTEQLRRLEKFATENSDAAYGRFLLGYHYGFLGYPEHARRELQEAIALEDRDELAGKLLEQFGGTAPRSEGDSSRSDGARTGDKQRDDGDSRPARDDQSNRRESLPD